MLTTLAAAAAPLADGAAVPALLSIESLVALATLTLLEIVLGIDNIVFIAILVAKLPAAQQRRARRIGLSLAMLMRIALLLTIGWIAGLTAPFFEIPRFWAGSGAEPFGVSGRDLILLLGGLFLIGKATWEIHDKLESPDPHGAPAGGARRAVASFRAVIVQILLLDVVFSLDSVITAVGMAQRVPIMIIAIMLAVGVMLVFAAPVSAFVERHPTVKMLALAFLLLIGATLVLEGCHGHVSKGYIYFAMAFSLGVEMLNLRLRARAAPVHLRQSYVEEPAVTPTKK